MNSQPEHDMDVLIAGAGPTGMMLAHLLQVQGIRFRIVDANPGRVKESRALAIQAKSMELFQSVGLVEEFLKRGAPTSGITPYVDGKPVTEVAFSGIGREDTPYPYIFILSQSETEEILEGSLFRMGVSVERQTRLQSFEDQGSHILAHLERADGSLETVRARYLVGCDGAKSQVRKSSGLGFEGGTYNQEFMLADVKVDWDLPYDGLRIFIGEDTLAVFFPLKGSEYSRIVVIGKNEGGTAAAAENLTTKTSVELAEIHEKLERAAQRKITLRDPLWKTRYRVHHRRVEKMRTGRVFLAGDAAHIHSPAGGQGMNTGLQDAANLAWKLAAVIQGRATDDLLETYNSERLPIAQKLLSRTDRMFSMMASFHPLMKLAVKTVLPIFGKIISSGFQPRFLFNFVSQLNIRYHPSLAVTENFKEIPKDSIARAGRRAPDAPLKSGGTLFERLQGYKFHLVVMSIKPISNSERVEFESRWKKQNHWGADALIHWMEERESPVAFERYGVTEILVTLIRPDGYIAYQRDWLVE